MKKQLERYVLPYSYKKTRNELSHEYIENRLKYIRPYITNVQKILELGCGEGLLSEQIQIETGAEMYGVDISVSGVRLARKRGIHARIADLNNKLPFEDGTFGLVLSDQLLEHIYKTDHLISEIYRVLKPGGIVLTITPNLSFWLNRILFLFGFYPLFLEASERTKIYGLKSFKHLVVDKDSMGHIRVFNKAALKDIFQNHGFSINKIRGGSLSWNLPIPMKQLYDILDNFFSLFASLSRDLIIIANKPKH